MKILAVSDKVEESFFAPGLKMPELEGIELIIACGDLPSSYLEYLVTILNVPLFYVLGNHDPQLYGQHINGCTCLDESTVLFKDKIIGGLSGSIKYSDAKLMYTEMQMHGKIARFRQIASTKAPIRRRPGWLQSRAITCIILFF